MKQIPLTQGKFALVDDEDYDFLMQWKWWYHTGGYAARNEYLGIVNGRPKNKHKYMHRIINKTPDNLQTDHKNGDKLDNQKLNLRNATCGQNLVNRKTKGIQFDARGKRKYRARICVNKKALCLGSFFTEQEALNAYNNASLKYHGVFSGVLREG